MRLHGADSRTRRMAQGALARRAVGTATRNMRGAPMASNEFLPFLAMCTAATVVYSLACWIGWSF